MIDYMKVWIKLGKYAKLYTFLKIQKATIYAHHFYW